MSSVVVVLSSDELGRYALERAKDEARSRGIKLVIAAGVSIPRSEEQADRYKKLRADVSANLDAQIEQARAEGLDAVGFLPSAPSDAAEAALTAAETHDASLIVVGLRKRSPVGKLVLGSMSQDIILGARCDVLGVKLLEPGDE
jgi:nucleotide-binding universal stress UspA family protein